MPAYIYISLAELRPETLAYETRQDLVGIGLVKIQMCHLVVCAALSFNVKLCFSCLNQTIHTAWTRRNHWSIAVWGAEEAGCDRGQRDRERERRIPICSSYLANQQHIDVSISNNQVPWLIQNSSVANTGRCTWAVTPQHTRRELPRRLVSLGTPPRNLHSNAQLSSTNNDSSGWFLYEYAGR